jgi:hypothetical protein
MKRDNTTVKSPPGTTAEYKKPMPKRLLAEGRPCRTAGDQATMLGRSYNRKGVDWKPGIIRNYTPELDFSSERALHVEFNLKQPKLK